MYSIPSYVSTVIIQSKVCVHTYSESDHVFHRYGRLKFSKMAAGRHLGFDPTGKGTSWSAVLENPTLEPNMKGIGWRLAELGPFEIFPKSVNGPWGRSVVNIHTSYTDLIYSSFATFLT